LAPAMEDDEIQHQHAQREKIEKNPEIEQRASRGNQSQLLIVDC
jgi:hypothetical protein